jgi:hypothetical protein
MNKDRTQKISSRSYNIYDTIIKPKKKILAFGRRRSLPHNTIPKLPEI